MYPEPEKKREAGFVGFRVLGFRVFWGFWGFRVKKGFRGFRGLGWSARGEQCRFLIL